MDFEIGDMSKCFPYNIAVRYDYLASELFLHPAWRDHLQHGVYNGHERGSGNYPGFRSDPANPSLEVPIFELKRHSVQRMRLRLFHLDGSNYLKKQIEKKYRVCLSLCLGLEPVKYVLDPVSGWA